MGIKLSSLLGTKYRVNGSRKSKGKFSFVQKIKYFYLTFKYGYFGIEKFTDNELSELINLLNLRAITYQKTIEEFEKQKTEVDQELGGIYETVGSLSPQEFQDIDGNQKLVDAAKDAIVEKKAIDKDILQIQRNLGAVNDMKEAAEAELETRDIDRQVAMNEIKDEIAQAISTVQNNQEVKEEPAMEETVSAPVVEPINDDAVENLEEKIVSNVEPEVEAPVEPVPVEETPEEVIEEQPVEEAVPVAEPAPVEEVATPELEDEEDIIENMRVAFNQGMDEELQRVQNDLVTSINDSLTVYTNNITVKFNEFLSNALEKYRESAQNVIDQINNDLTNEQNKNAELTQNNEKLTNDLNSANETIGERDATIEELNGTIVQKETEINDKEDQNAKLTQANNNLEKEKEDLIKENDAKDAKIRELEAALAERNKDVADREEEIAKRDQEINGLNTKIEEVQKAKQESENKAIQTGEAIETLLAALKGSGINPTAPTEGNKTR